MKLQNNSFLHRLTPGSKILTFCSLFLLLSNPAKAQELEGFSIVPVESLTGTATEVLVDLGSGSVETGAIEYTLDPELESNVIFNYDLKRITFNSNLLLSFPLLETLQDTPLKVNVVQTAIMPDVVSSTDGIFGEEPTYNKNGTATVTQNLLPSQTSTITGFTKFEPPTLEDDPIFVEFANNLQFFGEKEINTGSFDLNLEVTTSLLLPLEEERMHGRRRRPIPMPRPGIPEPSTILATTTALGGLLILKKKSSSRAKS